MSAFTPQISIMKIYSDEDFDFKKLITEKINNSRFFNDFILLKLHEIIKSINLLAIYKYNNSNIEEYAMEIFNSLRINELNIEFDARYGKIISIPKGELRKDYLEIIEKYQLAEEDVYLFGDTIDKIIDPKQLSKLIIDSYIEKVTDESLVGLKQLAEKIQEKKEIKYSELRDSINLLYEFSKKPLKLTDIDNFDFRIHDYNEEYYISNENPPESQVLSEMNTKGKQNIYTYALIFMYEVYED